MTGRLNLGAPLNEGRQLPLEDDDEINLGALLAQLWGGRYIIAFCLVLGGAIGLLYALTTPPVYQANALLQLEERSGRLALPNAMTDLLDNSPQTATEIEILRSRMVLGRAASAINLDWSISPRLAPIIGDALTRYSFPLPEFGSLKAYARKGETIRMDLLQVPPDWVGASLVITSGGDGSYQVALPDGETLQGQVGTTLQRADLGFAIRIGDLVAPAGREFVARQRDEQATIGALRDDLSVAEQGRGTGILRLTLNGPSPDVAQRWLDAVAQAYLDQNIARSMAEADSSLEFVEGQIPAAERAVRDAEQALNDFQTQQQAIDIQIETESLITQISALEEDLRRLDAQEAEIKEQFTPNHPTYRRLLENRARLEARLEELRAESSELPETQRELINLNRELELAQSVYVELLNRAQELRVLRASSIGNVRIVDRAEASPVPIAPQKSLIVMLALILGGLAGAGIVVLRNMLRRTVPGPEVLERLGMPVFATVNLVEEAFQTHRGTEITRFAAIDSPTHLAVEALRSLRTSLHFGMLDSPTRSVVITSPAPGAGKSFTAANLAVVSTQAHQRVCIIDADMRRGTLRRYFGTRKGQPGLAEVLAGDVSIEDAIVPGPLDGLFFLPPGQLPPNPSELLMRDTLRELLASLDTVYDLTIVDAPPVLAVTDPVILGRAAGTTMVVVRHDVSLVGEVEALQKTLRDNGVRIAGSVLNGFDPRKASRYGRNGYTYGYRYEYQSSDDGADGSHFGNRGSAALQHHYRRLLEVAKSRLQGLTRKR